MLISCTILGRSSHLPNMQCQMDENRWMDRKIDLSISKFVSVHLQHLTQGSSSTYICSFESNQPFWLHFKFKSYFKNFWFKIFEVFSDYLFKYSSMYVASQVELMVKNLCAKAEDTGDLRWILGPGRSPEGVMATHSSILAGEPCGQKSQARVHGVTRCPPWLKWLSRHAHSVHMLISNSWCILHYSHTFPLR